MEAFLRIMIVCIPENRSYWEDLIPSIENSLGTVRIIQEEEVLQDRFKIDDDLIVVDVTQMSDLPKLVSTIRSSKPDSKILLAATTPTWREARTAFYLGATDYIRKQSNVEEMIDSLKEGYSKSWKPYNSADDIQNWGRN